MNSTHLEHCYLSGEVNQSDKALALQRKLPETKRATTHKDEVRDNSQKIDLESGVKLELLHLDEMKVGDREHNKRANLSRYEAGFFTFRYASFKYRYKNWRFIFFYIYFILEAAMPIKVKN